MYFAKIKYSYLLSDVSIPKGKRRLGIIMKKTRDHTLLKIRWFRILQTKLPSAPGIDKRSCCFSSHGWVTVFLSVIRTTPLLNSKLGISFLGPWWKGCTALIYYGVLVFSKIATVSVTNPAFPGMPGLTLGYRLWFIPQSVSLCH